MNKNETAAAAARRALLEALGERQDRVAFELFSAAKHKYATLTFGLLQTALLELIAARQVRVDARLRIAEPTHASTAVS